MGGIAAAIRLLMEPHRVYDIGVLASLSRPTWKGLMSRGSRFFVGLVSCCPALFLSPTVSPNRQSYAAWSAGPLGPIPTGSPSAFGIMVRASGEYQGIGLRVHHARHAASSI